MKLLSSRYYLKLILFSFVLCTLPVVLVGIFSYYKSSSMIQDKVITGNMQVIRQTQMRMEQMLKIIDSNVVQLINTPSVSKGMTNELTPSEYNTINDIIKGLSGLQSYESPVSEVYMINFEKDWLLTSNNYFKPVSSEQKEYMMKFANVKKTSYWVMDDSSLPLEKTANVDKAQNSVNSNMNLIKKILPLDSLGSIGIICVKIPARQLCKYLINDKQIGEMIVLDSDYRVIADTDETKLGKDLGMTQYVQQLGKSEQKSGYFNIEINQKKEVATYIKSDFNGWIYMSVVPTREVTRDSRTIGWVTFLTSAGTLLIMFLFSIQGSKSIYYPIKKIHDDVAEVFGDDTPDKGSDEFLLINRRIHTLLNRQSQMATQIKTQVEQLREFFAIKLLQGEVNSSEISSGLKMFGNSTSWQWMSVMVVEVDTLDGTEFSEKDRDLLMFAINNIIGDLVEQEQRLVPVILGQNQVTLIGSNHTSAEAFNSYIYAQAQMIQKTVKDCLQLSISIGLSRPFCDFMATGKAYQEGREALRYKIGLGQEAIINIDSVNQVRNSQPGFPKQLAEELIFALKAGNRKKVDEFLPKVLREIFSGQISYLEYQVSLGRLLADMVRVIQDMGESAASIFEGEKSLYERLFSLKNQQEAEVWFKNTIIEPTIQFVEKSRMVQYKKISEAIIEIIQKEYDTELTLEVCASRINYNPNYISRVFREETGINFSDYLSQYRIEIAKKWLRETDIKITEIADRLKYNNAQNFIRYFKKQEGITPGQYRDRI